MHDVYGEELDRVTALLGDKVSDIALLARGRRGVVFTGTLAGQKVAIKVPRSSSSAQNMTHLEAMNLQKVNSLGIGPRYIEHTDAYLIMEYVDGTLIGEFLKQASRQDRQAVLSAALKQCGSLDEQHINKFEMTNPYKHIIVKDDLRVVFIDFERARATHRPKNVAQFQQYLKRYES